MVAKAPLPVALARRRPSPSAMVAVALVAVGAPVAVVATSSSSRAASTPTAARIVATRPDAAPATHRSRPVSHAIPGVVRPAAARRSRATDVARLLPGRTVLVRSRPGGRIVARMSVTQFGSRVDLPVLSRHGRWAGVPSVAVANGHLGWIDTRSSALSWVRTAKRIVIDVGRRRLRLEEGGRTLLSTTIGVGAPGTPTPKGRYAITDKLAGPSYNAAYGCCILAISGHQTHLPPGWNGGNRLAIHGTNAPATIGEAATTGCLHVAASRLRELMRRVPLGTPVVIT